MQTPHINRIEQSEMHLGIITVSIVLFLFVLPGSASAMFRLDFDDTADLDGLDLIGLQPAALSDGALLIATDDGQLKGILTDTIFDGELEIVVRYADHAIVDTGYQGVLQTLLVDSGCSLSDEGACPIHEHKIHETIDYSWYTLAREGDSMSTGTTPRLSSGAIRILRQAGELTGWFQKNGDWVKASWNGDGLLFLPHSGPAQVGVRMAPGWNTHYSAKIEQLTVYADKDADGLLDDEEALIGTEVGKVDTDGDGLTDREDLRPHDATFDQPFTPAGVGANPALEATIHKGLDGAILIVVKNPTAQAQLYAPSLPDLPTGMAVDALFEAHSLVTDEGGFSDVVPAHDRRVYRIDWDLAPLGTDTPPSFVRPLSAGPWSVDLQSLIVDLEDGAEALSWSVVDPIGGLVDVAFSGGQAVVTPVTETCGSGSLVLQATDTHGGQSTISIPVALVGDPGEELFDNPDFEQKGATASDLPGWKHWVWDGSYSITLGSDAVLSGESSAHLYSAATGKAGVYQKLALEPGAYRLTASVASWELTEGLWGLQSVICVLFADGTTPCHNLVGGDSGWHRATLELAVTQSQEITIYFFQYGAGHFFIDDVSFVAQEACTPLPDGVTFSLSDAPVAPLEFTPPLALKDTVLCGYCDDPSLSGSDLCVACASADLDSLKPPTASGPLVLADFEDGSTMPFLGQGSTWTLTEEAPQGDRAALLPPNTYMDAYPSGGLSVDWTGHDYLRMEVYNPSPVAESFYVEIRDIHTTGYWSRVNWYTYVAPGHSTLHVPTVVYVGEKSLIKNPVLLDLGGITRLVVSNHSDDTTLVIDNIRLEPAPPYAHDFDQLIKLDVGTVTSPVFYGFTPLYVVPYKSLRGYGISEDADIARVEDRRHPDDLFRDWMSFVDGGLMFDVPDGAYRVWMMLEDPGYWEFYPHYSSRAVYAEGQKVHAHTLDIDAFWARYYAHEDDEELPGDDIWERYIATRYVPVSFTTEVTDGRLDLRFEGSTYACALSALVIFPESKSAEGEAFLEEMWARLKARYSYEYTIISPAPPQHPVPAGLSQPMGQDLLVFQRGIDTEVQPTDWPATGELIDALSLTLAAGEYEPMTVSLYPKTDLVLTDVDISLPGLDVDPALVRYKLTRMTADGVVSGPLPLLLDPITLPYPLPVGIARRLWVTVHAPESAQGGVVQGHVTLTFLSGQTLTLPVEATVLPFTLPEPDVTIGYLGTAPTYPGSSTFPEIAQKQLAEVEPSLQILRAHGMTGVTGGLGGPQVSTDSSGNISVGFDNADLVMALYKQYFDRPVNSYFGFNIGGLSTATADTMKEVLSQIETHAQSKDWLPVYYNLGDEPSGDTISAVYQTAKAYEDGHPESLTSVYTSFTDPETDPRAALVDVIDLLILNHHSQEAIDYIHDQGRQFATYNTPSRYSFGFYLYKLSKLGCVARYLFAYSSVGADPYYALDAREGDLCAVFTHSDGSLRPLLELERLREGVDDLRYMMVLEDRLANAPPSTARDAAQKWMDDVMAAMPVSHTDAAWADTELDGLRKQVIAHIEALQCADGSCGSIPDLCAGTDPTGDINQSGLTDVADVQCMALVGMWKYYGEEGPSPQCALAGTGAADLSCDGVVTVTDIKVAVLLALDLKLPTFLDEDHNRCVDACE